MTERLAPHYRAMVTRIAPFAASASWPLVVVALMVLWFGFRIIFTAMVNIWAYSPRPMTDPSLFDAFAMGSTPVAVGWSLATFLIYLGLLRAIVRLLHGLKLRSLIGNGRAAVRQFARVSLFLTPLYVVLILPAVLNPVVFQNLPVSTWLMILPAMMPLLFLQISVEELVFRGYLQSHLAVLARHPIIWMGLPSFLFGLAHYDPYAPTYSAWSYVAWATLFGLVCADLTARSGNLGPAFAVHFANNFFAVLFLSSDDWLFGAALYIWPLNGQPWEPWIPYEALSLLVVWLTARIALRR